jgi:hypothetical protein
MKAFLIAISLAAMAGTARAEDCSDPLVKSPQDAGRIAFAMLHALNSRFPFKDERKWLSRFTITLHDCVWSLHEKPDSTFNISIGAKDGRFLGAEDSN